MLRVQIEKDVLIDFGKTIETRIESGTKIGQIDLTKASSILSLEIELKSKGDKILQGEDRHCYIKVLKASPFELKAWAGPLSEDPGVDW